MRLSIILAIVQKELTETLRDRRTLFRMVILPILLYPILALGLGKLEGSKADAREARASIVAIWGELPPTVTLGEKGMLDGKAWLGAPEGVRRALASGSLAPIHAPAGEDEPKIGKARRAPWSEPENPVITAARAALAKPGVDAVVVPWPGFRAAIVEGRAGEISIYYDSTRPDSTLARERVDHALTAARREAQAAREIERSLPIGFTTPVTIMNRNVAPTRRAMGQILGAIMPMLMIVMSLLGGFLPAIDSTAGEKERGTMQTLLCAPLRPIEIIAGKFIAVFTVSLLAALANVVSLSLTIRRLIPYDIGIPLSMYALTFALLVPVSFFFAAVFLAVAAFARDFKDGQNALTPAYLPILMLSAVAGMPGFDLDAWTAFVPVMNVALLIKALFAGDAAADLVFLVLVSSGVWAALALTVAARVFEAESVLLGGNEPILALLLPRRSRAPGEGPTAGFALGLYAIALVASFYGSLAIARAGSLTQILVTEYVFLLAPVIVSVLYFRFPARETLALRAPSLRAFLGAILIGASAWTLAITLARLVPPPRGFVEQLTETLLLGHRPLPIVLLCAAVTPAICEELFFRGVVFAGLRRHGPWVSVVASALLFALLHGSIYRLIPTFTLGLALGWVRLVSRSIVPSMVVHALNNGIALTLMFTQPAWLNGAAQAAPWWLPLGGAVVFGAGLWASRRRQMTGAVSLR